MVRQTTSIQSNTITDLDTNVVPKILGGWEVFRKILGLLVNKECTQDTGSLAAKASDGSLLLNNKKN